MIPRVLRGFPGQLSHFRNLYGPSVRGFSSTRTRFANYQYQRFGQGQGQGFARRQNVSNLLRKWVKSPTFYYQIGGAGGAFGGYYIYNLETVPVSGRRRFNIVTPEQELKEAQTQYSMVLEQFSNQILPDSDSRVHQVRSVLNRLISTSGLEDLDWEVNVIDSPEQNAFVMPGGKVFVFTGVLPICQNEDGIATVLGHEIAHVVAHHAAERISKAYLALPAVWLAYAFSLYVGDNTAILATNTVNEYAWSRPGSRTQEAEADYIGLMMMAQACFNPDRAVGFWERMQAQAQQDIPQWLSTHPSNHNRSQKLTDWLPEARDKRQQSDCRSTLQYADDFKKAFTQIRW